MRIAAKAAMPKDPELAAFKKQRTAAQTIILSLGLLALVVMSGATVWLVRQSDENSHWVSHSMEVQYRLTQLQLMIRRAESGQRGYLLTDDRDYLEIYQESVATIPRQIDSLVDLVSDNPDQQRRVETVAALARAKVAELQQVNEFQVADNDAAALDLIRGAAGKRTMTDFVTAASAFRTAESTIQAERIQRASFTNQLLLGVAFAGAGLILILTGITIWMLRRFTARLVEAQKSLAEANAHLEEKVEERTADLKEANDELQRFAYIVSHDLRSPLVNIMGFTGELSAIRGDLIEEQAAGGEPDPKRQQLLSDFNEALGFITSAIGKMDRLIKAILDLSRAGRRDFRPEELDLGAILTAITDSLAHQTQEVGAEIVIHPMPAIESDRVAIEQIFSNLVDNAVKYLRPGRPGLIEISAEEKIGFAVIRVADNGRGIDTADRERVFELFRRAGAQDRPGEGIGLAHVRALVRRLGGTIRLDSEFGEGSTFTVILPKRWKT